MMTTLSPGGWSRTNGRLGSSTIGNAKSRPPSRTIVNFSTNARDGPGATGEAIILAFSQRDMSGRKLYICLRCLFPLTLRQQSTAMVYIFFAYCYLHLPVFHL